MNILLVNPEIPDTYWGFKHALRFTRKKSLNIPLGLITVASMLPREWNKKLTDMNVSALKNDDIGWADLVFISAMSVQSASVKELIQRCRSLNRKMVAGGPLFTEEYESYPDIDYLVLNEAEITLPEFIDDLEKGSPRHVYSTNMFADLGSSPLPDYSLLQKGKYAMAGIQYSRGCPFDCEFCDITALFGHRVRTKTPAQIIDELDLILSTGWRGSVFFVDDNFIGHKQKLKKELLPEIVKWMQRNDYPFNFTTEASINLADDSELMQMMVMAGFEKVFVGIETPEEVSLSECNKVQNIKRNMILSVDAIQKAGMEVTAGFIVGFDNDPSNIFQKQIEFIQKSGIVTAMVGLLNAPKLSRLYRRLKEEGRILDNFTGDNTDYTMNFKPVMDKEKLMNGYQKIIHGIYSNKAYYQRVLLYLKKFNPPFLHKARLDIEALSSLFKSVLVLGILKKERRYYWNLFFWSLFRKPEVFKLAIRYSIYGYHFRKVYRDLN
jgi:radical SAM superfamily enzyme YgiQ (UPF0313 family)